MTGADRGAGPGPAAAVVARRENLHAATLLREGADLLEQQGDNPFRVAAYRRGADTVEALDEPLAELVARRGRQGLDDLPQIGPGIASAILQILRTGRWGMLERLRGEASPEKLFQTVPGIGPRLAERLHAHLGVDTLEGLEVAAYDGRLEAVPGIGPRRVAAIRASLASLLGRPRRRAADRPRRRPGVALLLAVDEEYRRRAAAGELPLLAPRRFNPAGRAWLPVLHTTRDGWSFTALFSNTALAHQLGRTGDWVVLSFSDSDPREDQATVVTEARGILAGRRVVRGREAECQAFYTGPARRRTWRRRRPRHQEVA
ncbi:MAG TPA: helix-hairpin-helix domain-containing protein [Thermoanaerobaculia bacterium]